MAAEIVARTLLAFDCGEKKVGVAVGNSISRSARPLEVIRFDSNRQLFGRIESLIAQWQPDELVVGQPFTQDGEAQGMTELADRFSRRLTGRFGLPVTRVDERFSSTEASYAKRDAIWRNEPIQGAARDESNDALAAAIFLRQYLNEQ